MNLHLDRPRQPGRRAYFLLAGGILLAGLAIVAMELLDRPSERIRRLRQYWADPEGRADWAIQAGQRCGEAPFTFPTDGFVGFGWGDSFRLGHTHQGVDIFGPSGPHGFGETPVYAAYDGYLTRLPDWRSSVIVRIENDPLQPGRQIWAYYTHMASQEGESFISDEYPAGTFERFVTAGTFLGYQGNYSGDADNPTGLHLHFSIVQDDGQGNFLNELNIENTLDPSPYLGIDVSAGALAEGVAVCQEN